jgi:hypothetical protein
VRQHQREQKDCENPTTELEIVALAPKTITCQSRERDAQQDSKKSDKNTIDEILVKPDLGIE